MKTKNLNYFMVLVICTVVCLFVSEANAVKTMDDPFLSRTFDLASGELNVSTSGGSIRVEGGNSSKVQVEMYVKSNKHSDAKMKEILEEDYEINIEKSGSTIQASAERTGISWSNNGINISFVVFTPKNFKCNLHTSGGSLKISGVTGSYHKMTTSGGSITAEEVTGDLDATTSGGSINVEDYNGDIDASTSGGSINLGDITGDIDVTTSGGGIRIKDVVGSVHATTSGGSIKADISSLKDQLILKTSGGSVRATIPSGLGLDLDLRGNRVNTSLNNFSGESKSDRVRGTVNGGGIEVLLATSGGSVNLDYK